MEWSRFSEGGDDMVFGMRGMKVHRERRGEGWGVAGDRRGCWVGGCKIG